MLLSQRLPEVQNAVSSSRIKYTAISASTNYLVCGANTGSLYVFNREGTEMLRLISNSELPDPVHLLSFNPSDEDILAIASTKNIIYLLKLNLSDRNTKEKILLKMTDHKTQISSLIWSSEASGSIKIYSGDIQGQVWMTDAKKLIQKTVQLFDCKSPVVQLDCRGEQLLISSRTQVLLIDFEKQKPSKIGSKPRNGDYGVCFHPTIETHLLASRPSKYLWEASTETSQVLSTIKLKDSLQILPNTNLLTRYKLPGLQIQKWTAIQLRKLEQLQNYVISWDNSCLIVIDPQKGGIVEWHTDVSLVQLVVSGSVIYLLHETNDDNFLVYKVELLQPLQYALKTFEKLLEDTKEFLAKYDGNINNSEFYLRDIWFQCASLIVTAVWDNYQDLCEFSRVLSLFSSLNDDEKLILDGINDLLSNAEQKRIERKEAERIEFEKRGLEEKLKREAEEKKQRELQEKREREENERRKKQLEEQRKQEEEEKRRQEEERIRFERKQEEEKRKEEERKRKIREEEERRKKAEQEELKRIEEAEKQRKALLFSGNLPQVQSSTSQQQENEQNQQEKPSKIEKESNFDYNNLNDDEFEEAVINIQPVSTELKKSSGKRKKKSGERKKRSRVTRATIVDIAPPKLPSGGVVPNKIPEATISEPKNWKNDSFILNQQESSSSTTSFIKNENYSDNLNQSDSDNQSKEEKENSNDDDLSNNDSDNMKSDLDKLLEMDTNDSFFSSSSNQNESLENQKNKSEDSSDITNTPSQSLDVDTSIKSISDFALNTVASFRQLIKPQEEKTQEQQPIPQIQQAKEEIKIENENKQTLSSSNSNNKIVFDQNDQLTNSLFQKITQYISISAYLSISSMATNSFILSEGPDKIIFSSAIRLELQEWIKSFSIQSLPKVSQQTIEILVTLCFEHCIPNDKKQKNNHDYLWNDEESLEFIKKYSKFLILPRVFYILNQRNSKKSLEFLLLEQKNISKDRAMTISKLYELFKKVDISNAISILQSRRDPGFTIEFFPYLLSTEPEKHDVCISFLTRMYPAILPRNFYDYLNSIEFQKKSKLEIYRSRKFYIKLVEHMWQKYPKLQEDRLLVYNFLNQCMSHEGATVDEIYEENSQIVLSNNNNATTGPSGNPLSNLEKTFYLLPKYRTHLYEWGHKDQIMNILQHSDEFKYERNRVINLCKEKGFVPGIIYFYILDKKILDLMIICLSCDDKDTFQSFAENIPNSQWINVVRMWMSIDRSSHNRSITSAFIMSLILRTVGATDAIQLLDECQEFADCLPMQVYSEILKVGQISTQQDNLLPGLLELINTHLWSPQAKELAPQIQYCLEKEMNGGKLNFGEIDNSVSLPRFYEESRNHWGVTCSILTGYCPICTLPISESPSAVVVFPCGHAYHQSCNHANACNECFQMDSLLHW